MIAVDLRRSKIWVMAALNRQTCIRTCSAQYNLARRGQWYGKKRELTSTTENWRPKEEAMKSQDQTKTTTLLGELKARGLVNNITKYGIRFMGGTID